MEQKHIDAIQTIMNDMECPKDFECYKQGFEDLCQTRNAGLQSFVECLKSNPQECSDECPFTLPFGRIRFCYCPLRVYATTKLK